MLWNSYISNPNTYQRQYGPYWPALKSYVLKSVASWGASWASPVTHSSHGRKQKCSLVGEGKYIIFFSFNLSLYLNPQFIPVIKDYWEKVIVRCILEGPNLVNDHWKLWGNLTLKNVICFLAFYKEYEFTQLFCL